MKHLQVIGLLLAVIMQTMGGTLAMVKGDVPLVILAIICVSVFAGRLAGLAWRGL